MTTAPKILIIGTFDTKSDELDFLRHIIELQGGNVITMDVSVLGEPKGTVDYTKHEVATAGGSSIEIAVNSGDENTAMQIMASGAVVLTKKLYRDRTIQGMIALGGTMGTDLALDCAKALPIGVPKYIVSTVAYSHLIPPDRISADVQMILWAGRLFGLNSICKSSLAQAAGGILRSVVGSLREHRRKLRSGFAGRIQRCAGQAGKGKWGCIVNKTVNGAIRASGEFR